MLHRLHAAEDASRARGQPRARSALGRSAGLQVQDSPSHDSPQSVHKDDGDDDDNSEDDNELVLPQTAILQAFSMSLQQPFMQAE